MKRWVKAGVYCLLVIALIVGLGLPTAVGYIQDIQTDQTVKTVSATSVQLDLGSATTLLQKYRIMEEIQSQVKLDSAQKMDSDQALEELMSGLDILFASDEEEIPYTAEGFAEVNHSIYLKMDGEDSLIYWDFLLEDESGDRISAAVDDDTGIIIYLKYTLITEDETSQAGNSLLTMRQPLFLNQYSSNGTDNIFSENGIFGNLEETGYSAEEFTEDFQNIYCSTYLRRKGYRFSWEVSESEYSGNSYLYSVMMVNNQGGYYVLTFSVSNDEIIINP